MRRKICVNIYLTLWPWYSCCLREVVKGMSSSVLSQHSTPNTRRLVSRSSACLTCHLLTGDMLEMNRMLTTVTSLANRLHCSHCNTWTNFVYNTSKLFPTQFQSHFNRIKQSSVIYPWIYSPTSEPHISHITFFLNDTKNKTKVS